MEKAAQMQSGACNRERVKVYFWYIPASAVPDYFVPIGFDSKIAALIINHSVWLLNSRTKIKMLSNLRKATIS